MRAARKEGLWSEAETKESSDEASSPSFKSLGGDCERDLDGDWDGIGIGLGTGRAGFGATGGGLGGSECTERLETCVKVGFDGFIPGF